MSKEKLRMQRLAGLITESQYNKNLNNDYEDDDYLNEDLLIEGLLLEDYNFNYSEQDYDRYLKLEDEITDELNKLFPNDRFWAYKAGRSLHKNDKDLIFSEMHFVTPSDSKVEKKPFSKIEQETIINKINELINKYEIKSVKFYFNPSRQVYLEKFKDNKIKKVDRRKDFTYPINGKKIKFIIADRDIVPFAGVSSLKNIFNNSETLSLDKTYHIVSYLSTSLIKFIKIDGDIFNLNDVEKAYVEFFQDTIDIDSGDNVGTKDIMFKKYILNKLKIFNNNIELNDLFDMLETIRFDFVYYDSFHRLSGENYVRNLD
jgi:hypothetical protein